jgi:division/cell wall cluster transcriptional repressor MraZ
MVPALWRSLFAEGAVLGSWLPGCLGLWRADDYDRAYAELVAAAPDADSQERFLSLNSRDVDLDGAGRIALPAYMRAHAGIADDLVIVGSGTHLELWSSSREWNAPVAPVSARVEKPIEAELARNIEVVRSDLFERMQAGPELMHQLTPRQFEEFVAELYSRQGFEVVLTPETRDGGVDLYVVEHTAYGRLLTVVDCKRLRPDRPVGVELVRTLLGTIKIKDASAGVIATTSRFTKDALAEGAKFPFRVGLQDYFGLQTMLSDTSLGSNRLRVPGEGPKR